MKSLFKNSILLIIATVFVKIISLSVQVILGYVLEIENFGYYASALGAAGLFQWLKNGAILQYAIKESVSGKYEFNCDNYVTYFNVVSSIFILLLSIVYYGEDNYIWLILFMFSISQLVSLSGFKNRLVLIKKEMYKELSLYEISFGVLFSLGTLLGAYIFEDERCYFLGILFATIYELYYYKSQKQGGLFSFSFNSLLYIWGKGRWLLLGALGSVLVMKGGFIIIEHLSDYQTLGIYFFSFQLASSISILLGESIRSVVMPFLAKKTDSDNQLAIYSYLIVSFSIVLIPLSLTAYPLMEPMIIGLWGEKWVDAVYPTQLFMATMFFSILISLSYSQLEAAGMWKVKNISQVLDGLFLIVAAGIGALLGGVDLIVYLVVLRRIIFGLIQISLPYVVQRDFNFVIFIKIITIACVSLLFVSLTELMLIPFTLSDLIVDLVCFIVLLIASFIVFMVYYKKHKFL